MELNSKIFFIREYSLQINIGQKIATKAYLLVILNDILFIDDDVRSCAKI